ncbi:MAG: hypothetical protein WCL23_04350 [Candidatus Moraniibacteriota bacterium]
MEGIKGEIHPQSGGIRIDCDTFEEPSYGFPLYEATGYDTTKPKSSEINPESLFRLFDTRL